MSRLSRLNFINVIFSKLYLEDHKERKLLIFT